MTSNGSEFRSNYRLKSIKGRFEGSRGRGKVHHSPNRSHYDGIIKRVTVDLMTTQDRNGVPSAAVSNNNNMNKMEYTSYANSSNIIDDFESDVEK